MGNRAQVIIDDLGPPVVSIYTHWYSFELWRDVTRAIRKYPELWDFPVPLSEMIFGEMHHGKYVPQWSGDDHGDLDFYPIHVDCKENRIAVHVPAWTGYLWIPFEELVNEREEE